MSASSFELSAVIGIRNWGLDRLDLTLRTMRESTLGDRLDVVIADCGSDNRDEVAAVAAAHHAQYVYCDAPEWSRPLALNTGIAKARSHNIIAADADFLFSPEAFKTVVERLTNDPLSVIIFQAADLPETHGAEALVNGFHWDDLARVASMRPCWGMGCAAFTRESFELVRGYEERMVDWGAEDNDFVKRVKAVGRTVVWMDEPEARMYHIWHPPFLKCHPNANEIFNKNRNILLEDQTIVRNLTAAFLRRGGRPTVSVVVATYNRAHLISDMIESVLGQTVQDLELLLVDDASMDNTREVVRSFNDDRIRYIRLKEQGGVGRARNIGNQFARGVYIAVHDDDDVMVPRRLEYQLGSLRTGDVGGYGGWIDFNQKTGQVDIHTGKTPFCLDTMMFDGKVLLHPTLLLRRDAYLKYSYKETLRGGSDYNFMMRMARDGLQLRHCGQFVILRQFHDNNLSVTSGVTQKVASKLTTTSLLCTMSEAEEAAGRQRARSNTAKAQMADIDASSIEGILRLLPDSLVHHYLEASFEQISTLDADSAHQPMIIDYAVENGKLTFTHAAMLLSERLPVQLASLGRHRAVARHGTTLADPSLPVKLAVDTVEDLALHRLASANVTVADFHCPEARIAHRLATLVQNNDRGMLIRRGNDMWSLVLDAANDDAKLRKLIELGGTIRRIANAG